MIKRLLVLITSLLSSSLLLAQHPTETEPNNTAAQANTITLGQTEAALTAGDTDWFKFTLATARRIRLDTSGLDTRFTLFDAAGVVPLGHDDDSRGVVNAWGSNLWLNLAAGTYTLRIVPFAVTDIGPYSIDFASFPTKVYTSTEAEPNNTYLTANVVPIPAGGAQVHGNIGPSTLVTTDATPASTLVLSDVIAAQVLVTSKTVLSSTTTVITPVGGGMTASAYIPGHGVLMTSGVNIGQIRAISANAATTISCTPAWTVAPAATDTFDIVTYSSTTATRATATLTAGAYATLHALQMTSGVNNGLIRTITANTASVITHGAFPVANAPGDTFNIVTSVGTTTVFNALTAMTPSSFLGGLHQLRFTSGSNNGMARQISANSATTITTLAFPGPAGGGDTFVVEIVDTDYYQFTLTAPRTGVWFLITEGDAPAVHGHRYEIYDAAGVLVLASSTTAPAFGVNNGTAAAGSARTTQQRVWPAGTYHIAIRTPTTSFVAPNDILPAGNYCLELFADMTIGTGATVAEVEPNNTFATASPLTFGQRGTGNLTISSGLDARDVWGPFTVPNAPCTVTFQSGRGTPTPIADTTVNLLSSTGVNLTGTTGATGNLLDWTSHGRLVVSFTGGGTYYVEVVSPGTAATQAGDYVMEISNVMATPYQTAAYTLVAANATCGGPPFPTLATALVGELPTVGSLFSRNINNCPANGVGFLFQGFSNLTANGGATPLPFDMTPLGAPGCTINVDPMATMLFIANGAGTAMVDSTYPPTISLRGLTIFEQAVVLNPSSNALGVQLSNYAAQLAGERSW